MLIASWCISDDDLGIKKNQGGLVWDFMPLGFQFDAISM
jgi:hypothetical protein